MAKRYMLALETRQVETKAMLTALQTRKLTKLFSMYDTNCTGVLMREDFDQLFKKMASVRNWSVRSPRCMVVQDLLTQMWNGLAKKADKSQDKAVCLEEWLAFKTEVLASAQSYAQEVNALMELVFDVFDQDSDGKLSQTDWERLLSVYNVSPVYGAIAFPALNPDADGLLTKECLLQWVQAFYYSDTPDDPANGMFGPF
jgi:Ca2+-binding EF-hand superfamily protein